MPSKSIIWAWIYCISHISELLLKLVSDITARTFIQCCTQFSIQNNLFFSLKSCQLTRSKQNGCWIYKNVSVIDARFDLSLYFYRLVNLHLCAEKKKIWPELQDGVSFFLLCKKYIYEFTCVQLAMTSLIIHYVVLDFLKLYF